MKGKLIIHVGECHTFPQFCAKKNSCCFFPLDVSQMIGSLVKIKQWNEPPAMSEDFLFTYRSFPEMRAISKLQAPSGPMLPEKEKFYCHSLSVAIPNLKRSDSFFKR